MFGLSRFTGLGVIHSKQIGFLKVLYRTMKVPYRTLRLFRPSGVLQTHERVLCHQRVLRANKMVLCSQGVLSHKQKGSLIEGIIHAFSFLDFSC